MAIINIVVSVATVKAWGLIGVAIGTLVAMTYQTIWMAIYDSKHLIKWPINNFLKQLFVDALTVAIGFFTTRMIIMQQNTYIAWVILALETTIIWVILAVVINFTFYRSKMFGVINKIYVRIKK